MTDSQVTHYKGYSLKALVFKQKRERGGSADDRTYEVVVRIESAEEAGSPVSTFKMAGSHVFYSLGEARRAGEKFGRDIIDGSVAGCSVGNVAGSGSLATD